MYQVGVLTACSVPSSWAIMVLTLQPLSCVPQLQPEGLHCAGGFSTLQQKLLKALACSRKHTFWAVSQHAAGLSCQRRHPPPGI